MTRQRVIDIAVRLAEVEEACNHCMTDDPPWSLIEDAISIANELLAEAGDPLE